MSSCALGSGRDKPVWVWEASKTFSVKTMCMHTYVEQIWKTPIKNYGKPKIVQMWLVQMNVILTKDNLVKRN